MVPKAHLVTNSIDVEQNQDSQYLNKSESNYQSTCFIGQDDLNVYPNHSSNSVAGANNFNDDSLYMQISSPEQKKQMVKTQLFTKTNSKLESYVMETSLNSAEDNLSDDDQAALLPNRAGLSSSSSQTNVDINDRKQENAKDICLQIMFPFVMAGFGMVAVGIVLDKVQVRFVANLIMTIICYMYATFTCVQEEIKTHGLL